MVFLTHKGDFDTTPNAQGEFNHAPYLNFNRDNRQVKLNANHVDNPNSNYGSGSLLQ